jgi:D-alanyl-lipoteichoic acid acyltransferase DltB (MBOAT superfamily)
VAGPIERATHLLPQVEKKRIFDYHQAVDGLRQVLWGLFKKIVIADNCAVYANDIFNNSTSYSGSTLLLGALFFTFQIYGDFSGYTDIAKGTAKLLGFDLLQNFKFPYFSRSIAEFWRRWHISLSSWFRDYLYIPLGGSKVSTWMRIRNTFIIFLVSGFWHGANWTFLVWGGINALFILPSIIFKNNRNHLDIIAQGKYFPNPKEAIQMVLTFSLTVFAWIFFRAEDLSHAFAFISGIFSHSIFQTPEVLPIPLFALLAIFMTIEWLGRENNYAIENLFFNWPVPLRWGFYFMLVLVVFLFSGQEQQFIYFQF